jgi:hypothetical protein
MLPGVVAATAIVFLVSFDGGDQPVHRGAGADHAAGGLVPLCGEQTDPLVAAVSHFMR